MQHKQFLYKLNRSFFLVYFVFFSVFLFVFTSVNRSVGGSMAVVSRAVKAQRIEQEWASRWSSAWFLNENTTWILSFFTKHWTPCEGVMTACGRGVGNLLTSWVMCRPKNLYRARHFLFSVVVVSILSSFVSLSLSNFLRAAPQVRCGSGSM